MSVVSFALAVVFIIKFNLSSAARQRHYTVVNWPRVSGECGRAVRGSFSSFVTARLRWWCVKKTLVARQKSVGGASKKEFIDIEKCFGPR